MSKFFESPVYAVVGIGLVALLFAYVKSVWVNEQEEGTDKMKKIGGHIREGAMAFLSREYRVLAVFVAVVAVLLAWSNMNDPESNWMIAISFVVGAVCSGLAGLFGMRVATAANYRTTAAARKDLNTALHVAFTGGTVMGMSVVGLGVVGLSTLYLLFDGFIFEEVSKSVVALNVLSGFSLGASSIALFARVGGGIYTKAADVGADLVGKVEAGIPEDDPRNPATIADNVGDNVGDVAGMGADLFESYVGAIISSMILGWSLANEATSNYGNVFWDLVTLPLYLAAAGIAVSIVGTFLVRTKEDGNPQTALHFGTISAALLMTLVAWFVIKHFVPQESVFIFGDSVLVGSLNPLTEGVRTFSVHLGIFLAAVLGLVSGTLIGLVTEYYTSDHRAPVHSIAKQAETGAATVIIAGLGVGMMSTTIPVILIAVSIVGSYYVAGLYGIAIAALGMLSTTGIQLAVDAYGPIADNAGGIAEMAGLEEEVRQRTDKLDAVGNTTAAIGKGFAIGSAALTALALFSAFTIKTKLTSLDVMNPMIMAGVFIGAMLPYLFSALAMNAVGRAAFAMIEEVRRQFREIKGLLEGEAEPEYAKCVEISTDSAIREMILPGLIAVVTPVAVGLWSIEALGGLLVGVTVSGVALALFMSNAGGAWDNAKKYIEGGKHGGKGSEAHHAAVVGDTVGDPFKDTAGPSLNILIKLMSVVAVVVAPVLVSFHAPDAAEKAAAEMAKPVAAKVLHVSNINVKNDANLLKSVD
ncbi:MAG TPA: sodium-translocating pyrophosphatase [Myxococcales bacterium]|nr:sodium-translocating pyrophosphatase [Myxococcales bacterium]HIN86744.1 sodium-translocating pyrophosphatase [Myxococcales bacterium]